MKSGAPDSGLKPSVLRLATTGITPYLARPVVLALEPLISCAISWISLPAFSQCLLSLAVWVWQTTIFLGYR